MSTTPPRRAFIVEDDPEVRDAIALLLSTAGVETQEYASAEGFWESAPHDEPYCAILDHQLPGMSGVELLALIAERSPRAAVILLTGHGDVPTAVRAMKLGAFHFMEKPFDGETFLNVVEDALRHADASRGVQADAARFKEKRESLTEREAQVFGLLLEGAPTKTIAARLDVTQRTAEHHRAAVMRKFDAKSISALMRLALARNE